MSETTAEQIVRRALGEHGMVIVPYRKLLVFEALLEALTELYLHNLNPDDVQLWPEIMLKAAAAIRQAGGTV